MNCFKFKKKDSDKYDFDKWSRQWLLRREEAREKLIQFESRLENTFQKEMLDEFKEALLEVNWSTVNEFQSFPWAQIRFAAQNEGKDLFIEAMIDAGWGVNNENSKDGKALIHLAAHSGNISLLTTLVKAGADVNLMDSRGDTPLQHILKKSAHCMGNQSGLLQCFEYLTQLPEVHCDLSDKDGFTPIHFASFKMKEQIARRFIDLLLPRIHEIDLDVIQVSGETARTSLQKNHPDLENKLPEAHELTLEQDKLFCFLEQEMYSEFMEKFTQLLTEDNQKHLITCAKLSTKENGKCNGKNTYLQVAIENGETKLVQFLLDAGADVNVSPEGSKPPIELACKYGYSDILDSLLKKKNIRFITGKGDRTLLHETVRRATETNDHLECLQMLLDKTDIDINAMDQMGRTPLRYAVLRENEECILQLLDHGAHINTPDCIGRKPISSISYGTFKKFLDSKITTQGQIPRGKKFAIQLDYKNFLREVCPEDKQEECQTKCTDNEEGKVSVYEFPTDVLIDIKNSKDLERLVAHPLLSCVIYFKWYRIRWLFFVTLFVYSLFCGLFTTYTLLTDYPDADQAIYLATWVFYGILLLAEFMQFMSDPSLYFFNLDNVLRLLVLMSTAIDLGLECGRDLTSKLCQHISASSILIVWFEFFFILGKWPSLTFYVNIFVRSFKVLIKFLLVHVPILIGFGFSFHILFGEKYVYKDEVTPEADGDSNHFANVFNALFKTLVMLTGEYNASDLHEFFAMVPGTSHIIFVAFICVISIVLVNLLIGLANNATRDIEDNPFLHKCIAQVGIISNFERAYFNRRNCIHYVFKRFFFENICSQPLEKIQGDTEFLTDFVVKIYPNSNNQIQNFFLFSCDDRYGNSIKTFTDKKKMPRLDDQIAIRAQRIATKHYNKQKFNKKNKKKVASENLKEDIKKLIKNIIVSEKFSDGLLNVPSTIELRENAGLKPKQLTCCHCGMIEKEELQENEEIDRRSGTKNRTSRDRYINRQESEIAMKYV